MFLQHTAIISLSPFAGLRGRLSLDFGGGLALEEGRAISCRGREIGLFS
jgi:hypothetical protein